jgi:thiopurine S-methyltransferase
LEKHLERLTAKKEKLRFLFPLCGKAVDIAWLASMGHTVVGIEFVENAIEQFFQEQNIKFTVTTTGDFKVFTVGLFSLKKSIFVKNI